MTPDWLATEDGRKMMEAYLGRPLTLECGRDVDHFIDSCRACLAIREQEEISMRLGFALPHLDRMLRERYAKELEAEVSGDLDKVPRRPGESVSDKWYYYRECAAFLRREPTL